MKLVTTAEAFLKALKDGIKVEKRSTIPILGYVKVNGDNPSITATDLDTSSIIGLDGEGSGEFLIPYHAVKDVLTGEKGKLVVEYIPGPPHIIANPDAKTDHAEPTMAFDEWLTIVETRLGKQLWEDEDENGRSSTGAARLYALGVAPEWYASPDAVKFDPGNVKVNINGCEYEFYGMRMDNYPVLPTVDGPSGYIPGEAFKELLERTSFAISREESRYTLNGALLILKGETARMVATDGHRLSLADVPGAQGELQTLIPQAVINYLEPKAGADGVCITVGEDSISFSMGNRQFISRKLTGQFPNYEAVMPRTFSVAYPIDTPATIAKTLARVAKCADERSGAVRWTLDPSGPQLHAESTERGKAKAQLPGIVIPVATETAGDSEPSDPQTVLSIGLNSAYIAEFLKIAGDEPVTMRLKDSQSAALFSSHNENNGHKWDYVVMPMRM